MEDLSTYLTLYQYCSNDDDLVKKYKVARNCCAAVAELHEINIVHGDLSSENILINGLTSEVKLIDFDMSSIEDTSIIAGGNPDFISEKLSEQIDKGKKIKSSKKNDLYSLAVCCYLLVGDEGKTFFISL